ncbi:long-chain fatty acid--CoA ligase [Actinomadura viridis]|uniref:Long-chain acyl-CoA synthetase n=1 Tax=Actinomadura viridis TaxID=58110 RepID=A0A931DRF5_9ACTN|nr:long-chain fatty acid--CoA ligase [Actinomadura viridis]MBG6091343.1 long-chain acyl-CoA synthetase [Actinomadura viridis]
MLNLSVLLEDAARKTPDRDAVVFGDMRLSYAMIDMIASQVAHLLRSRGIGVGDKVALSCPNVPYFPMVYFGILKAGAAVVPLNVLLKPREITYHLDDSDAKALFVFEGTPELPLGEMGRAGFQGSPACEHLFLMTTDPGATESPYEDAELFWPALAGLPGTIDAALTGADDTAVILYTSGTTGQPKGAELSHSNMLMNAFVSDAMFERTDHDVSLVVLPMFHAFGQSCVMNVGFRRRSTLVLQARFEPAEALRLMAKEKVSIFAGVPTMYWALLSDQGTVPVEEVAANLHTCVSGGASLPLEVLKGFEKKFGVKVLEGYGLSETSPVASFNQPDRPTKPGSIGTPIWGVDMKLIDEEWKTVEGEGPGEIAVRGHNIMKGYYGRPEATEESIRDGWFRTGDIARRDEDGFYYIIDRSKDMIIRGGFNVYPRELEEVLMTHPAVSLAAVVGVPHDSHGEEIKAYVIRRPDATVTEEELIAWGKENFASYKYPRIVEFRDELPMTATGKILKRELR